MSKVTTSRWDKDTETWNHIIGFCPFCEGELIENPDPDLKLVNHSRVHNYKPDNQFVLVCDRCVKLMEDIGEVALKQIGEWSYVYEFVYK